MELFGSGLEIPQHSVGHLMGCHAYILVTYIPEVGEPRVNMPEFTDIAQVFLLKPMFKYIGEGIKEKIKHNKHGLIDYHQLSKNIVDEYFEDKDNLPRISKESLIAEADYENGYTNKYKAPNTNFERVIKQILEYRGYNTEDAVNVCILSSYEISPVYEIGFNLRW